MVAHLWAELPGSSHTRSVAASTLMSVCGGLCTASCSAGSEEDFPSLQQNFLFLFFSLLTLYGTAKNNKTQSVQLTYKYENALKFVQLHLKWFQLSSSKPCDTGSKESAYFNSNQFQQHLCYKFTDGTREICSCYHFLYIFNHTGTREANCSA